MIHIHELGGCAPAPLAHYLKALGLLRLIAEQADREARGWWEGERFRLATCLSRGELEGFLLERYEPTPLVAPWNGGTGFYPKDKKARKAIENVIAHPSSRFGDYRQAIAQARAAVGERKEAPYKKDKEGFIQRCFLTWRGGQREALACAIVMSDGGKPAYPSLLGTGFNDGRLDFTSNFMERLITLLPTSDCASLTALPLLRQACWGEPAVGMDAKSAIGQFLPGGAGGANSLAGPDGDPFSNPWDFVLMLEGTIVFTAHATRRLGVNEASRAAAPFAVNAQGAGYPSAADSDESARGEQWMPLWSQPMTLVELKRLLAEGRAQIGPRMAREPLDLARAVARLGTARGIVAFQRYGYIERNGQSNLAVPLGRFDVPTQTSPRISCLDDLDAWLPRLRREAHDTHAPARLAQAERRLADALFAVVQHPDEPARWQRALFALAEVEAIHRHGGKLRAGPIPRLRPGWVEAANDGSNAFRLALSCALQAGGFRRDRHPIDGVRRHWLPEKNGETAAVMQGRDGMADAIALVERRLIEATQRGERHLPLIAAHRAAAHPADLAAWLTCEVDPDRTLTLVRTLMALDARAWATNPAFIPAAAANGSLSERSETPVPDDGWVLLRLALLPWPLPERPQIGADPAILRRLASGDAAGAVEIARRRLGAVGVQVTVRAASVPPATARRWAAALAFPISRGTAARLLQRLDPRSILGDQS